MKRKGTSGLDKDRTTARFVTDEHFPATFTSGATTYEVVVRDVSVIGAQIEHTTPLRPAMEGRLSVGRLNAPAVVVWTRMSTPGLYRSGLRLDEKLDVVAAEIRGMLADGKVHKNEQTLREREQARLRREMERIRLVGTTTNISQQDVQTIRGAREWLLTHPEEAVKWQQRAKMTATEDMVMIAGSGRLNREDVLAVWELLQRRFNLRDVVRVLD